LRVDQVELDDGTGTMREVVEHRGAAAVVPILEDRVILVRQFRYAASLELLEIPAGTLEQGETPEACARRELEEETGYRSNELRKFLECFIAPGYSTEKIHFYLATKLEHTKMMREEDERIKIKAVPIPEALNEIRSGEIRDAKTICALYRAVELL
jgi:ADP-ribose pyrophosphatase